MGAAVIAHLSRYANLSGLLERHGATEGFIAGQAVASAISELYHDGKGVAYNDVDAFLLSNAFNRKDNQLLTTLDFETLRIGLAYKHLTPMVCTVYEVCGTQRDGMLNEVLCSPQVSFEGAPYMAAMLFLQSFDLNCVQVGVRLSDQQLVWTPAFETFMATREMLVMNIKTPMHTAIRWFRKKQELEGVFGHDDRSMELLTTAILHNRRELEEAVTLSVAHPLQAQSLFGPGYAEKARAVRSTLARYFDLVCIDDSRYHMPLHRLEPQSTPQRELLEANVPPMTLPLYARALQGHWKRHVCSSILEAFNAPEDDEVRMAVFVEGVDALHPTLLGHERNARLLRKSFHEHQHLRRYLPCMDAAQQLAFVKALKELSHREGLWVYGIFETLENYRVAELGKVPAADMATAVERRFREEVAENERLVAERPEPLKPLLDAMEMNGYRISELTTFRELADESTRMHHCVAGYFRSMVQGRRRIVRLHRERARDSLTMELVKDEAGVWRSVQLRGVCNRIATPDERKVGEQYVALANVQELARRMKLSVPAAWLQALGDKAPGLLRRLYALAAPGDVNLRHPRLWQRLLSPLTEPVRKLQQPLMRWMTAPLHAGAVLIREGEDYRRPGNASWCGFCRASWALLKARLELAFGRLKLDSVHDRLSSVLEFKRARPVADGLDDFVDDVPF